MESILQNGENPNKGNKNGAMPVHEVAMNESDVAPQIVEILMERGGPGGLPNWNCPGGRYDSQTGPTLSCPFGSREHIEVSP